MRPTCGGGSCGDGCQARTPLCLKAQPLPKGGGTQPPGKDGAGAVVIRPTGGGGTVAVRLLAGLLADRGNRGGGELGVQIAVKPLPLPRGGDDKVLGSTQIFASDL